MAQQITTKLSLAETQLESAISLFLTRKDRLSAITLAGAADGILHGLVLKAGKQPFADYALGIAEAMSGATPAKAKFAKHINDKLNINDLKHMDEAQDDQVTLDVDISALGAILKAIANYKTLTEEETDAMKLMYKWAWLFYDGERIKEDEPFNGEPAGKNMMQSYADRPQAIKDKEAALAKRYQEFLRTAQEGWTDKGQGEKDGSS